MEVLVLVGKHKTEVLAALNVNRKRAAADCILRLQFYDKRWPTFAAPFRVE